MRTAPKSILLITALALAAGLTGCSAGGQSTADACKLFADEATKITGEAQSAMTSAATDPQAAVDAFKEVQTKFDALGEKITNAEVKPAFTALTDAYADLGDLMADAAGDPAKAEEASSKLTDTMTKVSGAASKIQEACS